jgi:hypothetical protein
MMSAISKWIALGIAVFGLGLASEQSARGDLIGYWEFDGNGVDSSGGGRDLTLQGGVGFAPGLFGQALDLHGNVNQYAVRPISDPAFNFGANDFTIQIWANFNSMSSEPTLMEKFSGGGGPGWTLTIRGGNDVEFYAQPAFAIDTGFTPTLGVWHQFLVRRSGSVIDLFYDGNIAGSANTAAPIVDSPDPLLIGRRDAADGRGFPVDGRLDEAAIWNNALTDSQIAHLWNNGAGNPVLSAAPEPSTLVLAGVAAVIGVGYVSGRRSHASCEENFPNRRSGG